MVHAPGDIAPQPWVEELPDVSMLRAFLGHEPAYTAYFLGDLDQRYFEVARWFVERDATALYGVVLVYIGQSLPAVLTYGPADSVARILAEVHGKLPDRFELHAFEDHLDVVRDLFPAPSFRRMVRMALRRGELQRPPELDNPVAKVRTVSHADTPELVRLYARAGVYAFDPYQLETGFFFGVREEGRLVSVAGVHVVSAENDIAVIGNVATHPDYRGRGFSSLCTARLVEELLRRVSTIALNVDPTNRAAVHIYERLGFRHVAPLYVTRVGQAGPVPIHGR